MSARLLAGAALAMTLVLPAAQAQASEAGVLVRDPRGDAGVSGLAPPAGLEAWDLVEVAVVGETADAFDLRLRVASVGHEPPTGEVALHFGLGDAYWLVGWTVAVFPGPPFTYSGGFYCPADAQGEADPSKCDGFEATVASDAYTVRVNRQTLGATAQGIVLDSPRAYADAVWLLDAKVRVDETVVGGSYTFRTGEPPAGEAPAPSPAPAPPVPPAESDPAGSPATPPEARGEAEAGGAWLVLAVGVLAAAVRRRA